MSVRVLVEFIQAAYPPGDHLPAPGLETAVRDVVHADLGPLGMEPTDRPGMPEWLEPGAAIPLDPGNLVGVEGTLPDDAHQGPAPIDVLAYYLPFHFYHRSWGIYLRASGIASVASMLARASSIAIAESHVALGKAILVEHERFHFLSEVSCARAEVATRQPLYGPYFLDRFAASLEEALCNASSFRASLRGQPPQIQRAVHDWMLGQGPGYGDFRQWVSTAAFDTGRRFATRRMLAPVSGARADEPSEFLYASLGRAGAPIFFVPDVQRLGSFKPFPKREGIQIFVHTNDHPPPHIHIQMPPGSEYTRVEWPTLRPLSGDRALSHTDRRRLDAYIGQYGHQIEKKIRAVYGSVA